MGFPLDQRTLAPWSRFGLRQLPQEPCVFKQDRVLPQAKEQGVLESMAIPDAEPGQVFVYRWVYQPNRHQQECLALQRTPEPSSALLDAHEVVVAQRPV